MLPYLLPPLPAGDVSVTALAAVFLLALAGVIYFGWRVWKGKP